MLLIFLLVVILGVVVAAFLAVRRYCLSLSVKLDALGILMINRKELEDSCHACLAKLDEADHKVDLLKADVLALVDQHRNADFTDLAALVDGAAAKAEDLGKKVDELAGQVLTGASGGGPEGYARGLARPEAARGWGVEASRRQEQHLESRTSRVRRRPAFPAPARLRAHIRQQGAGLRGWPPATVLPV